MDSQKNNLNAPKKGRKSINLNNLKSSLKYRPEIYKLLLKLHQSVRKKDAIISKLRQQLQKVKNKLSKRKNEKQIVEENNTKEIKVNESHNDTAENDSEKQSIEKNTVVIKNEENLNDITNAGENASEQVIVKNADTAWNLDGDNKKSIADQVKEVAESALGQTGMVYVESAGMYYDYKTGYYYNSDLGIYYHTSTNCYYRYNEEKKEFVFHSYPDTSKVSNAQKNHEQYKKKLAKKHKKDIEENEASTEPKPKKIKKKDKKRRKEVNDLTKNDSKIVKVDDDEIIKDVVKTTNDEDNPTIDDGKTTKVDDKTTEDDDKVIKDDKLVDDLEDGECSDTSSDSSSESDEDNGGTTETEDDDEWVSQHHPPCMRVVVKETNLTKLKVGTLFLVTKDGGSIGREGDHHTIVLKDINVSRNHLDIKYDMTSKNYVVTDIGSRNGTLLNGYRMSESLEPSTIMSVPHGSILQLGQTKLLCHIHPGSNTCGHCEPGLIMEAEIKEKQVAYTRNCNVQQQHHLELARLKNKYAPEPLAIEDGKYNDRAKTRRETVGSTHNSEKTQQSDLETSIAPDNKGFQLLKKMGWSKGEGLGKDRQGETEPIALVNNESKAGLGAFGSAAPVNVPIAGRPLRLVAKVRPLRPPAKAFRDPLEEDD